MFAPPDLLLVDRTCTDAGIEGDCISIGGCMPLIDGVASMVPIYTSGEANQPSSKDLCGRLWEDPTQTWRMEGLRQESTLSHKPSPDQPKV